MILAYRHAYEGGSSFGSPAEFDSDMHAASHALIRLAVIVMGRFFPDWQLRARVGEKCIGEEAADACATLYTSA
jgi:hypothetical protein